MRLKVCEVILNLCKIEVSSPSIGNLKIRGCFSKLMFSNSASTCGINYRVEFYQTALCLKGFGLDQLKHFRLERITVR